MEKSWSFTPYSGWLSLTTGWVPMKSGSSLNSSALGKPSEYMGRTIVEAHKGLNITNAEFNHICKILNSVLREEGIDDQYIKQIELIVLSLKNEIVCH